MKESECSSMRVYSRMKLWYGCLYVLLVFLLVDQLVRFALYRSGLGSSGGLNYCTLFVGS